MRRVVPEDVSEALTQFGREGLGVLERRFKTPQWKVSTYPEPSGWYRKAGDPEVLFPAPPTPNWRQDNHLSILWDDWSDLEKLPSYPEVVQTITEDRIFFNRIYLVFGASLATHGWQDSVIDSFLQNEVLQFLVEHSRSFTFSQNVMDRLLRELEKTLRAPFIEINSFVPIWNVGADAPLRLADNVTIRRLTDAELSTGMTYSIFPTHPSNWRGVYLWPQRQAALCTSRRTSLGAEALTTDNPLGLAQAASEKPDMIKLGEPAAVLLNLLGKGDAHIGTPIHEVRTRAGTRMSSRVSGEFRPPSRESKATWLADIVEKDAESLWSELRSPTVEQRLGVALNRFSSSRSRQSIQEGILDLAISAEALFTAGGNTGELTFRTSLNAALFLGDHDTSRSELRRFFREVYKVRSEIVHGSARLASRPKDALSQMRDDLDALMGRGLRQAVHAIATSGKAIDWEDTLDKFLNAR